jgi:S1-C subfamily serine protease
MMSAYEVTVPRGAEHLRVDLTGAQADADLYIFIGGLRADPYEAEYQSRSYSSAEWLILDPVEDRTTRYGIMVLSAMDEVPSDFTIQARIGTQAPPELLVYPTLPRADGTSLSGHLYATVELLDEFGGGSGCIVSSQGHILTNYHVIEASYLMGNTVMVNMSLDHHLPPRELFNATIEAIDPQRDIALLKITSGIYGQPLPENLRLPYFSLGDPDELQIGESLSLLGFPAVGGLGSRATITLSRGVVSGFENRGFGTIIKTDGEINAGNSGGAAVNSRGLLIGLPTQVVGADAGQIAYIYPVNLVPPKWLQLISGR